ncbi:MAG: hypothetical protein IPQ09_27815 [Myxococcales bacterium]|nr:hypothetical protein [Myxococcales bacterium]
MPLPPPAAVRACHDATRTCVDGGGDRADCFATGRACVRAAHQAAFAERCASLQADAPAEVVARCAEGVEAPAGAN